ncbi:MULTISPECIES: restriction endonuclease subunit S [Lactococcus]|uniref:Restriction endonuclease subunit S n=1 Tax=Lactococcus petauri TaxID=1940789 RepID=A0AAJ2MN77_9LACT|nr:MULTISPECIES: restriction endonuclease subunit S [Lactococcus]MDT2542652.1 restriction endonuclease subunit S [Lactococcus petauri]MDT2667774.1 restriction endonuclease subunit S [Lactococcus petauri]QPS70181.1 restriction endonuclease subunit S [Lactococcus garvieae]
MAKIDDSVKKKVPELRFKGFTDEWEERKFADFIDVKSGKDYKHLNSGSIPVYGTGGYMLSVDRALSDIDAIGIGRKGTIDKPYLLKAPFWTVDTLFYAVPKQNIDLQFSLSIFKKINWKKFDESTGVPSLSKTVINSVSVSVPSYEEQQKIGSFFKQLDDTIALHQRKLDLLKEQKKGFLRKMFPKNGAKVPELRFAGFADDWEERNLGEWSDVRDGTHASPKYIKQGHPMVTSKNLTDSGLDMSDVSYLTDEDFNEINQRSKVDIGDILFGMIGTIGKPVIVDRDDFAIKNVALIKEKTSPEIINTWLIQYLKSPSFERFIQKENAGGTQKFIALGLIRDMKLMTPSVQEQARIGELLNHLDNLIVANQRKLDLLKEQKKGYLQKMFA